MSQQRIGTQRLHAGYTSGNGEPRNIPIAQSTTFRYATGEQTGVFFDLKEGGRFYIHPQNPTNDHVVTKICALEGGAAAMPTSPGQATSFYAIFNIISCGEHVVCSSSIYDGTYNLFVVTMKRMGIDFIFVDPDCTEAEPEAVFRPETRAVFDETIANSAPTMLDSEKFARVAHAHGAPPIVDDIFATPVNCRPFEWGVDIVTHSAIKYMDGHANAVGGAIVDPGRFDRTAHVDRFPGLAIPDEGYHGVTYTERFGLEGAYITKATAQLVWDFGAIPALMNTYLLSVGLETLPLHMARHCKDALAVARFLKEHPKASWVRYPGLEGDPYYEWARKYPPNGTCGMVSFGVKGGREATSKSMAGLELTSTAIHVADAKTCMLHPASTTHRQMSDVRLAAAEVAPDLVRFFVGIEDVNDILTDLGKVLEGA